MMKKKTLICMALMLCMVAQEAMALRIRIKVPSGSSGDENGVVNWIIFAVVAVVILVGAYYYLGEFKTTLRLVFGGMRVDSKTTLSKDQQRKILLSAPYSVQSKLLMNSVKTGIQKEERYFTLSKEWDIWNHETATRVLNEQKVAGVNRYFEHIAEAFKLKEQQAIQQYLDNTFVLKEDAQACGKQIEYAFKEVGNLVKLGIIRDDADFVRIGAAAWDASRLVYLARLCFESKYISEEEMWQFVDAADEMAHKSITSWEDYGKSYLIGCVLWGGGRLQVKMQSREIKKLTDNPKSLWNSIPFAK